MCCHLLYFAACVPTCDDSFYPCNFHYQLLGVIACNSLWRTHHSEGWRTWTMDMENIMMYLFYGDGDHHKKRAILCHNHVIAIPDYFTPMHVRFVEVERSLKNVKLKCPLTKPCTKTCLLQLMVGLLPQCTSVFVDQMGLYRVGGSFCCSRVPSTGSLRA